MCELPDVFEQFDRVARKRHTCCECPKYGTILPGQTYQVSQGLWDGKWETYKRCQDCQNFIIALGNTGIEDDCGGVPFGCLWDTITDHGDPWNVPLEDAPGWYLDRIADDALEGDVDYEGTSVEYWMDKQEASDPRRNRIPTELATYAKGHWSKYGTGSMASQYFDNRRWLEGKKVPCG